MTNNTYHTNSAMSENAMELDALIDMALNDYHDTGDRCFLEEAMFYTNKLRDILNAMWDN